MRIKQCVNGHFFDEDKYAKCPHCKVNQLLKDIPSRFRDLGDITFCGSGVTSQVYKISGESDYALKVIECGDSASKLEDAMHELRIMERLRGEPRVVQLCDSEVVHSDHSITVYILEEFLSTLSDYLSSKPFRAADILSLVIGVCGSLLACKERDVLHLDVQPKNIYVDDLFGIKLGDFSHSLFASEVRANHVARGTLAYMAPEVYQSGCCSEQSDLYSLGLILYALFNNKVLPFMESDSSELASYKRLAGTRLPGISLENQVLQNEVNRIINKACSYFAADRYSGLSDFREDLKRLLESVKADDEKNVEIISKGNDLSKVFDVQKRVLPVIYVLQTSGSMSGWPIAELNNIVQETMGEIVGQSLIRGADVRISALTFGDRAEWAAYNVSADDLQMTFSASGFSDLGPALQELNRKLTREGNDSILPEGCCLPIIIFVANGLFADDFETPLRTLEKNQWYKRSTKICFIAGDEFEITNLGKLTGTVETVLRGNDIEILKRIIRYVSVSASSLIEPSGTTGALFDADPVATTAAIPDPEAAAGGAVLSDSGSTAGSAVLSDSGSTAGSAVFFDADPAATTEALSEDGWDDGDTWGFDSRDDASWSNSGGSWTDSSWNNSAGSWTDSGRNNSAGSWTDSGWSNSGWGWMNSGWSNSAGSWTDSGWSNSGWGWMNSAWDNSGWDEESSGYSKQSSADREEPQAESASDSLTMGSTVSDIKTHTSGQVRRCRVCDHEILDGAVFCPNCGSKLSIEKPAVDIKKVEFSAIAPKQLMRGDYSIISVVMYEKTSRHVVESIISEMDEPAQEKRSGIHSVREDSVIRVVLTSPDIEIDDNEEMGVWKGEHLVFSFAVMLPEEFKKRQLLFTASVYVNDVIACKLKFVVKCSAFAEQKIIVSKKDIFSAFVSYASQDRKRVAAIIQGIQKARPDMDVFFDVESLRSGEDWEMALYNEIDRRDILYLCWSHFARESKWVDTEWRYALDQKGADAIEPIPIEAPEDCPPPKELSTKHFNDKLLYIMNAVNSAKYRQSKIISDDLKDKWDEW